MVKVSLLTLWKLILNTSKCSFGVKISIHKIWGFNKKAEPIQTPPLVFVFDCDYADSLPVLRPITHKADATKRIKNIIIPHSSKVGMSDPG
jgi:hypothetical protein